MVSIFQIIDSDKAAIWLALLIIFMDTWTMTE